MAAGGIRRKPILIVMLICMLSAIAFPWFRNEPLAAIPKLNEIRVALFIDVRGTVPSVTLSGTNGVSAGIREPGGPVSWFTSDKPVRVALDTYSVKAAEMTDWGAAKALSAKLSVYTSTVFKRSKQGKTVYQVYAGSYGTSAEAASIKNKIAAAASTYGINKAAVELTGPLHWSAGTYASEAQALSQSNALEQKGISAQVVLQGPGKYSVWVGEAADESQLEAVKTNVLKLSPGLALSKTDSTAAYFMKLADVSKGASAADVTDYYKINAASQKAWISPKGQSAIKVAERSDRTYRGSMEVSAYNGKLALINQLPFEQYLYGVVGTELGASFPVEALKAQAVAARTFALRKGMAYKIANISDTTYDQAYFGMGKEAPNVNAAVDATAGEVIVDSKGSLIEPLFSSNNGGMTADSTEVWGNPSEYLVSVPSPDEEAQKGKPLWHRIVLASGAVGYVRSDLLKATGEKNSAGFPYYEAIDSDIAVRPAPYVDDNGNAAIARLSNGQKVISIEQTVESNTYQWIRGPFTGQQMTNMMAGKTKLNFTGPVTSLSVSERGPSGRAIAIQANGQAISVPYPDSFRSVLGGLPSTRFEIDQTAGYTILGADGQTRTAPVPANSLYAASANSAAKPLAGDGFIMINGDSQARFVTQVPQFRFIGYGNGHGLGMSQWGAKAWADLGYDYQKILKYYYHGVSIAKG